MFAATVKAGFHKSYFVVFRRISSDLIIAIIEKYENRKSHLSELDRNYQTIPVFTNRNSSELGHVLNIYGAAHVK